ALELDPQDHEAMTLLAEVVGNKDKDLARELRVSALRTAPQNSHYRKNVLRRGGVAAGGALFFVGKSGLLAKLALLHLGPPVFPHSPGDDPASEALVVVVVLGFALAFTITRVRRRMHGKKLPPLVWEGTRADRRNADLVWFAWPAALILLSSVLYLLG